MSDHMHVWNAHVVRPTEKEEGLLTRGLCTNFWLGTASTNRQACLLAIWYNFSPKTVLLCWRTAIRGSDMNICASEYDENISTSPKGGLANTHPTRLETINGSLEDYVSKHWLTTITKSTDLLLMPEAFAIWFKHGERDCVTS